MASNSEIPEAFKTFLEWKSIAMDAFADLSTNVVPRIITKSATGSLSVAFDVMDGKSWDQIVGKGLDTVIDFWIVGKIGSTYKAVTTTEKITKGIVEGGVVWGYQETTGPGYFEQAFPAAVDFYETIYDDIVNGDGSYARSVWEGVKDIANKEQFMSYYKNITFDQFIEDIGELFEPSYSPPNYDTGIVLEGNKATVFAEDGSGAQAVIVDDLLTNRQQIEVVSINSTTYDITKSDNLLVRNAIFDIPKVSFLLSHILIKVGEVLDIGDQGLYTVKSGDTMSELAEHFGMTTQELLSYNTWLIDEGRVDFDQDKVLIKIDATDLTNKDHTLTGSDAKDRLIDRNGGDDTLIGGADDDYLEGGEGADTLQGGTDYDTYIADDGDTIKDEDGDGEVIFEDTKLTGGTREACDPNDPDAEVVYKGNGGEYTLDGGTLTFTSGDDTLTIDNFKNGDLGITLKGGDDPCSPSLPPKPEAPLMPAGPNFPSPLTLDLNGDGVTSTFIYDTKSYFDLNNDGMRERTGWVQSEDALLVFDANQNGIVDNGSELFGNNTYLSNGTKAANGFEALAQYDENKDGVIDSNDNIYNILQLWQDTNSNGTTDAGELHSLGELGVASINLSYATVDALEERNSIFQTSIFTTTGGDTQIINDVWFDTDAQDTLRVYGGTLSDTVAALPDFKASGRVEDLSAAMNENGGLEEAVTTLLENASSSSYSELINEAKDILAIWSGTDNIDPSQTRGEQYILNHNYSNPQVRWVYHIYAYARDVATLEAFWGETYTMSVEGEITSDVIGAEMSAYMTRALETLSDTVLTTLLAQQLYGKDIYDVTTGSLDRLGLFTQLEDTLVNGNTEDKSTAINLVSALIHRDGFLVLENIDNDILNSTTMQDLFQDNGVTYTLNEDGSISGSYADVIEGGAGDDVITAVADGTVYGGMGDDTIYGTNDNYNYWGNTAGHEVLYGGEGNDIIMGGSGDDILIGGAGDDTLYANTKSAKYISYGHDILVGGAGNDTLVGTGRNSTYIYNYGDGYDTIVDGGNVGTFSSDILELRGIRLDDVQIAIVDNDMIINILDVISSEVIGLIKIENGIYGGKIERFVFDDQTLDFYTINAMAQGLYKDDIYSFNRGDGIVTIKDYASIDGDTLQFGEAITTEDIIIKVSANNNDLIVALKEDSVAFEDLSDKMTINNWFDEESRIESFVFSDGTAWNVADIINAQGSDEVDTVRLLNNSDDVSLDLGVGDDVIVTANGNDIIDAGEGNDTINAGTGDDTIIGGLGDDTINAGEGNDIIDGGEGNDTINAGAGNDIIEGDVGDDILRGGEGHDIYIFNRGDGTDRIQEHEYYLSGVNDGGIDTIKFGEGIMVNDLIIKVDNNDLIIALKEDGKTFDELTDKVTIAKWFDLNYRVENFEFSDGTILGVNEIISTQATEGDDLLRPIDMNEPLSVHMLGGDDHVSGSNMDDMIYSDAGNDTIKAYGGDDIIEGGEGNDDIDGGAGDDSIDGGEGNDTLNGALGNDTLFGRAGDDTLSGNAGNDILEGGKGNDDIDGGAGDDTYIFNRGDGADSIKDGGLYKPYSWLNYTQIINGGTDTLQFGEGITIKDIIIKADADNNDLIVAIKEDGVAFEDLSDTITLTNWFDEVSRIESIIFKDGTVLDAADIVNMQGTESDDVILPLNSNESIFIDALSGDDTIVGSGANDVINAGEGNDIINAGRGNDTLLGSIGNDILNGNEGNDILEGGKGNDTLQGGEGDDTYIFNRGDGQDSIVDVLGTDTLQFGEGIMTDDLIVKVDINSNDLIVAIKEDGKTFDELGDKIVLKNWFNENYRIESITFEDGTAWNVADIINAQGTDEADTVHLLNSSDDVSLDLGAGDDIIVTASGNDTIDAGAGNDAINAGMGDDTIIGGLGDDTINAGEGNDIIDGGEGNDALEGDIGNDTLEGGMGSDMLQGGEGDDTYIFNRGDGQDSITDIGGADTLQFGESITPDDIVIKADQSSNNLIVALKEDNIAFDELSDKIIIENWFYENTRVESITFSDGTVLDVDAILKLQLMDDNDNYLKYLDSDNIIDAGGGNDTIEGGVGNDTYIFNRGDGVDSITDRAGINTLIFGADITQEDVEIRADNNYMIVALKENGVAFGALSDKIYFTKVSAGDYGLASIMFDDGSSVDPSSLVSTYEGTEGNDVIDLTYLQSINPSVQVDDSVVVNANGGSDTIILGNGANIVDMGVGDNESLSLGDGNNLINTGVGNGKEISAGDGDNSINIDTIESDDEYAMNTSITLGEGDNTIVANGGDGSLDIQAGSGVNTIRFSSDVDSVNIDLGDGNNTIEQLEGEDVDYVYYEQEYDEETGTWYTTDEIAGTYSYNNTINVSLGDGANEIKLTDTEQNYHLLGGSGDNNINIGKVGSDNQFTMNSSIILEEGNNTIAINSGDGSLGIQAGSGNNSISFSSDIDDVDINLGDGSNTIVQQDDDDIDYVHYRESEELPRMSYANTTSINLGNATNDITLSDTMQDYQLNLGDGDNDITIGKIGSDNSYDMQSFIDVGNGNNTIAINSGDGSLSIDVGEGNNDISFSADIDKISLFIGNGNNTITQIEAEDTDDFVNDVPIVVIQSYDYGVPSEEPIRGDDIDPTFNNNINSIEIGLGANNITLGASYDGVYFSYDAYESLLGGASSLSNTIDVGAGINFIDLQESSANQNIIVGAENYSSLSTYTGSDYTEVYLGDGDNSVDIKGVDELYAELGNGNNGIAINNSEFVTIYGSNTNNITLQNGSTFLGVHDASSNTIALGSGNDEIYTTGSDDIYKVEKGNSNDLILDMDGLDKIVFGEGISASDIKVFVQLGSDLVNNEAHPDAIDNFTDNLEEDGYSDTPLSGVNLVIQYSADPNDVITLINWYDEASRVEQFEFSDGTTLSDHEIIALIDANANDIIMGTQGDNTLDNAAGDDILAAGEGNDTYNFARGDSHDTIKDDGGFDAIVFGEGIVKDDLILEQMDNDLVISLKVDGVITSEYADMITIKDWFDGGLEHTIERFVFSDGTMMELSEMLELVGTDMITYYGTPEEDTLIGTEDSDIILARASDDVIQGGAGDDILFGEEGNDTLIGGEGYDTLYGGIGNDIYEIDRNMGDDTIIDTEGVDTLRFVNGITSEDIAIEYENSNLIISLEGTSVLIINWYASDNRIETFMFDDGTSMSVDDIINHQTYDKKGIEEGTRFELESVQETTYYGQKGDDRYLIDKNLGESTIADAGGNDTIEFASGITSDDISLSYENDDLLLTLEGTIVCIEGWYTLENRIETFEFEDGTTLNAQGIIDLMATDENDMIRSLEEGSTLDAKDGDDVLFAGEGSDTLLGGSGDDVYVVDNFLGQDVIEDMDGVNTIQIGGDITPDMLRIIWIQGSDDIYIYISGDDLNGITIKDWYATPNKEIVFNDGTVWNSEDILDAMGSEFDDIYNGFKDQDNIIYAKGGDDIISTFNHNDTLYGGAGDDMLDGGAGDDILIGGAGNDILLGDSGNDTYIFEKGFGKDTIYDSVFDSTDGGDNRIIFRGDIYYEDLIVKTFEGDNNLYIGINEPGKSFDELEDIITIQDWYLENNRIEEIIFSDGTEMTIPELVHSKAIDNGDAITALSEGGILEGTENDDTLIGNIGEDFILGLGGNDVLVGNEGNDTLIGGIGNDYLKGGAGDDVYFFDYGDGKDVIYDNTTATQEQYGYITDENGIERWSKIEHTYNVNAGTDTLYFGEGITSEDLIVTNDGYDLVITLKDSLDDELRIQDYYKEDNAIEYFGFSDGTIMNGSEIEALLFTPNDDDVAFVDYQDHILNGNSGDDIINGGNGNDTIDGEAGDDMLNGGFGDDVYLFGRGSGHDTIADSGAGEWWQSQSGSDTLLFKEGISSDDLIIRQSGNDIIIGLKEDGKTFDELQDTLRIVGALDATNPFESIIFESTGESQDIATLLQNTTPIASDATVEAIEDTLYNGVLPQASDVDGDTLTYSLKTQPTNGTVVVNEDGTYTYTPNENFNGEESFTYEVSDGELVSEATITLNVAPVNDSPEAFDATVEAIEDTLYNGVLPQASDVDGDTLTYSLKTQPTNGTVVVNEDGTYTYTPNENFNGEESFTYEVSDGESASEATITLNVANVRDDLTIYGNNHNNVLIGDRIDSGSYDTIYGYNGRDTLKGLGGNDTLYGGNGNDTLYGGDGDDILDGGRGVDRMYGGSGDDIVYVDTSWWEQADGGAGNDTLSYAHVNHGVTASTTGSLCSFFHFFGSYDISNFENLEGSQYSDKLYGDTSDNSIYGNGGNDTIYGDRGNDILYGEEGRDTLYGGSGEDIFVFDTELSHSNIDKIMDFSSNDDTLYLDNEVFAKLIEEGTLSADNFVSNTSGRAEDSDDYIIYESDTGKLFYDGDGNGSEAAMQIAQFGYGWSWSAPTITHEDIVVI